MLDLLDIDRPDDPLTPLWRRPPKPGEHLAYGYVRATTPDEAAVALLRKDMAQFCRESDYRLVIVAVDRDCAGNEPDRIGFTATLAALALPDVSALVLPTLSHLSDDPVVRQDLLRQVARTGAEVLTVYQERRLW